MTETSSPQDFPLYVANRPESPNHDLEVFDKYHHELRYRVPLADDSLIDRAIEASAQAASLMRRLKPYERQGVLEHCVRRFEERFDELAQSLCIEAGKPIQHARGEVTRLIDTFRIAAGESIRMRGEIQNLEISSRSAGYHGMWKRVPIGPCSFISPFNFPLNLAAHKIAPALAVGCPFILKPASRTPIGALLIGEILAETELPEGAFSILPCRREGAERFTTDERLKLLSFTGSPDVGWKLKSQAGKKKVSLELGGNAAVVIEPDADLDDAVQRVTFGAFYQAGQSCIGVQRILIHESIYETLRDKLIAAARQLKCGDPLDEATFIGPVIDEAAADRLESWINEAVNRGGVLLTGGSRDGTLLPATLLENVPTDANLCAEEAFGPVAVLQSYADFEQALQEVNHSKYGLQAGIFTRDLYKALQAWEELDVGGVMIGEIPSWRVDHMPYGGVKESGLGREGIRFSMEEMTEIRNLVIRRNK